MFVVCVYKEKVRKFLLVNHCHSCLQHQIWDANSARVSPPCSCSVRCHPFLFFFTCFLTMSGITTTVTTNKKHYIIGKSTKLLHLSFNNRHGIDFQATMCITKVNVLPSGLGIFRAQQKLYYKIMA